MSKQRDEFKASFQGVNAASPLKLNKPLAKNPGLKPPQVEVPQNEVAQSEASRTEVPKNEQPKVEVPQAKITQNELPRNELAQNEAAPFSGFFKLPHEAFFDETLRNLSGDEFRLFLWMSAQGWRFPDSDGLLRASVSYATVGTGMSHASVSRALKALREAKLIELVEADYKKGNVWRVSNKLRTIDPPPRRKPPQDEQPQNEVPRFEAPQKEAGATSNRGSSNINLRQEPPQNEAQVRSLRTTTKQETLSQWVMEYLSSIPAPTKRESERAAYLALRDSLEDKKIRECFDFLREKGELKTGAPVHSPMAYLGYAAGDVWIRLSEQSEKQTRQQAQAEVAQKEKALAAQKEAAETARFQVLVQSFEAEYPDLSVRSKFLDEFVKTQLSGIRPPAGILKNLAAQWWVENRSEVRTA